MLRVFSVTRNVLFRHQTLFEKKMQIKQYMIFSVQQPMEHTFTIKLCMDIFTRCYAQMQLRQRSTSYQWTRTLGSLTLGYQTFSRNSGKENLHDLISSQRPGDCNIKHCDQFACMKFPENLKCIILAYKGKA